MPKTTTLNDNHVTLSSSAEIDAIISPLKQHLGVTSLVYHHSFNNGSEIRLTNQPQWVKHFHEQGLYRVSGFEKKPSEYQSGFVVWSSLTHHSPILNEARIFNIDHGITIMNKTTEGCEFFFIGTTPDKPYVTNLLLNNMDFLHRFILYFKEQANPLIQQARANSILIPDKFATVNSEEQGIPYHSLAFNFNHVLKIKRFHLDNNITLTEREVACAKLLLQGKSARSIAETLFISPRTVETHLQHIKEKLNCQTKEDLTSALISHKIHLL